MTWLNGPVFAPDGGGEGGGGGAGAGEPSALAAAAAAAAKPPEGETEKSPGAEGRVDVETPEQIAAREAAEAAKPVETPEQKLERETREAAEAAAPKDVDGKPLPEKYEPKMPDGVTLDAEALAVAEPLFKEHKFSPGQAQAAADMFVKIQQQRIDAHAATTAAWLGESKADKEIGGPQFEANIGKAGEALAVFGTPRLVQIFDTYGLGNNPEVLRFCTRVGKAMGEGQTVIGPGGGQKASDADVFYPEMKRKA